MKTKLQTDFEIFNEAIKFAKKRGYIVPPMEDAVLVRGARQAGMNSSMRMWAVGLVYSHDFLKAFFGENLVPHEQDNELLYNIGIWAQQVAFDYEGKLYAAREGYNEMVFPKYDQIEYWASKSPTQVVHAEHVVMKLQHMAASIPIRTHRLKKVRVDDVTMDIPAWRHGLKQMTEYDNPFLYLKKYMDYMKDKPLD